MRYLKLVILSLLTSCIFVMYIYAAGEKPRLLKNMNASQNNTLRNERWAELYTPEYLEFRRSICVEFPNPTPGQFGEFINGVFEKVRTKDKVVAFTFDACGGRGGKGYNAGLIDYLRKEGVAATLFITGLWIDANKKTASQLAADTLFEIENHGLGHRLCSVNGASVYGIQGTRNVEEVVDEMELNARKIESLTGRRSRFFRSATAFTDETCTKIASRLGMQIVSYHVLSGDAIPGTPAKIIADNVLRKVTSGSIVIMHFNHPNWQEKQAMEIIIPRLKSLGYSFVKLNQYPLEDISSQNQTPSNFKKLNKVN
jgi:peptidoglycan/xylan/chitin deacetylase (PgdA/CDA1 family)